MRIKWPCVKSPSEVGTPAVSECQQAEHKTQGQQATLPLSANPINGCRNLTPNTYPPKVSNMDDKRGII